MLPKYTLDDAIRDVGKGYTRPWRYRDVLEAWLKELKKLRELRSLVNAAEMLLQHDDPYSDLGKLARATVHSALARWKLACSEHPEKDDCVGRQQVVEEVLTKQFYPLKVFADDEAFKDCMSLLAEHIIEALDRFDG